MPETLPVPRYCQLCGHFLVERAVPLDTRRRLQCEACGFVHYMNPRVVVSVIPVRDGRVLLQRRAIDPRSGYWTFPGGFLEAGERPEEGAAREAKEEAGLDVNVERLIGVYARPQVAIVLVVYEGSAAGEAFVGDHESSEVRWFAPAEIPWADLAFDTTEAALRDWVALRAAV
jgi:ADP-ribose pyrophosphatase YjhB (NUDIX family)